MEESFKVRVDRAFGSLEGASSSSSIKSTSSSLSSLWCLTDEEIERNEWIRDKVTPDREKDEDVPRLKNPKPYSSFLEGLLANPQQAVADSSFKFEPSTSHQDLESDIQELDDEDEDENPHPQLSRPENHSNEEWDIRSSVGMDCTLDNEEEEDAYDKVAVGREESADHFYMRDVNDYEVEIDSNNELPSSFADVIRDPRANHMAAKLRLKEDDESARKSGLQFSSPGSENNIREDGGCLKSILRENEIATKSKKQVCFEPGGKGDNEEIIGQSGNVVMDESPGTEVASNLPQKLSGVPDYVCNPSKYTHYTLDSLDDVDEESNRKAYMDFFKSLKVSNGMETQDYVSTDSPTSIIFTPKKSGDSSVKKRKVDGYEEYMHKKVVPISIAADGEICVMDEDEPEIATNRSSSLQKGRRTYRMKGSAYVG